MESHLCPFCNEEMTMEHKILYVDFYCKNGNHSFGKRLSAKTINKGELLRIKIRLTESNGEKFYLQVHYDEHFTEVWKRSNNVARRTFNEVFTPDLSDRNSLLNKIKTYLLFS